MARTKEKAKKTNEPRSKCFDKKSLSQCDRKVRSYRHPPGTVALSEIRKYKAGSELLIRKLSFQRLVKEIAQDYMLEIRFQSSSISVLQEAAEAYLIRLFEDANLYAIHAKRVTIFTKDMKLAMR